MSLSFKTHVMNAVTQYYSAREGEGGSLACRGPQWPVGTDKVPLRGMQSCWQEIPTQGGQVAPTIC